MPKLGGMAQLSRPYQIALLALGALVLVWFAALHRPGAGSSSSSSPSVSSSAGGSSAGSSSGSSSAGGSSSVYHGSAPGVEGLSKDINKAHGAVATSEHNAQALQQKSAQASGEAAAGGKAGAGGAAGSAGSGAQGPGVAHPASTANHAAAGSSAVRPGRSAQHAQPAHTHGSHSGPTAGATAAFTLHHLTEALHLKVVIDLLDPALKARVAKGEGVYIHAMTSYLKPASQATVAAELKHGKTVLLLFLNPSAYDDDAVAIETVEVARKLGHSLSVHYARASQVNSFGSITREIQVYQTPTLLIVNHKKQVTTLTGLTNAYAIEQAIAEARGKTFNQPGQS
jgi:hypothetical protein